jgi:peptidyl-tRNA hydrolase ICT1
VSGAAARAVKTEASDEQKERVRGLERAESARRKTAKMKQSAKKSSRSSKGWE